MPNVLVPSGGGLAFPYTLADVADNSDANEITAAFCDAFGITGFSGATLTVSVSSLAMDEFSGFTADLSESAVWGGVPLSGGEGAVVWGVTVTPAEEGGGIPE